MHLHPTLQPHLEQVKLHAIVPVKGLNCTGICICTSLFVHMVYFISRKLFTPFSFFEEVCCGHYWILWLVMPPNWRPVN